jgi:hypothetical protein
MMKLLVVLGAGESGVGTAILAKKKGVPGLCLGQGYDQKKL